ncbi:hypothetical protein WME94_45605 [Sorangium sp. So ce429]
MICLRAATLCMLDTLGGVRCLGANTQGMLGLPHPRLVETARRIPAAPPLRSVIAGSGWVCGLARSGQPWCVGQDLPAQLVAGISGAARLVGSDAYACALGPIGEATCFYVSKDGVRAPHRVAALDGARDVALPMLGHGNVVAPVTAQGGLAVGPGHRCGGINAADQDLLVKDRGTRLKSGRRQTGNEPYRRSTSP